jgi:hypothetical protein
VQFTQRVSATRLATGSGSATGLICDGAEHTTTVRVIASGGTPFKKGEAVASGTVIACGEAGCFETGLGTATVRVR